MERDELEDIAGLVVEVCFDMGYSAVRQVITEAVPMKSFQDVLAVPADKEIVLEGESLSWFLDYLRKAFKPGCPMRTAVRVVATPVNAAGVRTWNFEYNE